MIELRNLNKTFHTQDGALTALDDINLTIQRGEMCRTARYSASSGCPAQESPRWCDV